MRLKFSGHQAEVEKDYTLGQRIVYQGEGEVIKREERYQGEDGESVPVITVRPIVVELRGLKDGIYQEPEATTTKKHSWIYLHRLKVRDYWEQQLSAKYPDFDKYWQAYKDKLDQNITEKLQ